MALRGIIPRLLVAASLLWSVTAMAQPYPAKPIRIVVPLAAGGPTDVLARSIAQHLGDKWGQIVIDNRPGANTNIGTAAVAKSPADGYTLLLTVNNLTINPSLYPDIPFDPIRDFAPVILFATSPLVLVVNPTVPAKSLSDLVALAKAQPGKLHFGSPGSGSPPHLAGELLNILAGVKMVHVPYKQITTAVTDLIGGQLELMFPGSPIALPQAKAGKLRALATTGAKRTPAAPDLPTMAEAGVPNFDVTLWYGLLAPAGTPTEIVQKLNAEVARITALPEVVNQWAVLGAEPTTSTPDEFAAYLKTDITKWQRVVRASGAKVD